MKTINVDIKEKETNYNVIIGNSILNKLVDTLKKENKKVVVIMDFTIKNLYENKIKIIETNKNDKIPVSDNN